MGAMYGYKLGMTRVFSDSGESIPVTVCEMPPNVVHQVKTEQCDGYQAVQVGIGQQKPQRVNRPLTGHLGNAKKGMPKFVGELRDGVDKLSSLEVGGEVKLSESFEVGKRVDVTGLTQGKGFAGVIKRHGMKGAQTMTHGTHEYFRHAGSIGCRKFPGRVFKNKRMPGQMGNARVTQQGLEVIAIREDEGLLLIRGSIPGAKRSVVLVRSSVKQ